MHSPPFIYVAEVAIILLTVINCFLSAFFNADLVTTELKIPTPYSWSRIGVRSFGTLCDSVGLIFRLLNYNFFSYFSFISTYFCEINPIR